MLNEHLSKALDEWKTSEPDEQPEIAPVRVNVDYDAHDRRKLSWRFVLEGIDLHALTQVEEWLKEIEQGWRDTKDPKTLEFANSLKVIRERQIRN